MTLALTLISSDTSTYFQIFCDLSLVHSGSLTKSLNFPLTNFRIGYGFTGLMR